MQEQEQNKRQPQNQNKQSSSKQRQQDQQQPGGDGYHAHLQHKKSGDSESNDASQYGDSSSDLYNDADNQNDAENNSDQSSADQDQRPYDYREQASESNLPNSQMNSLDADNQPKSKNGDSDKASNRQPLDRSSDSDQARQTSSNQFMQMQADDLDYQSQQQDEDMYTNLERADNVDPDDPTRKKMPQMEQNDRVGSNLDVPGSNQDNQMERIGAEDEENNYYSLGGDRHEDLDQNDRLDENAVGGSRMSYPPEGGMTRDDSGSAIQGEGNKDYDAGDYNKREGDRPATDKSNK